MLRSIPEYDAHQLNSGRAERLGTHVMRPAEAIWTSGTRRRSISGMEVLFWIIVLAPAALGGAALLIERQRLVV